MRVERPFRAAVLGATGAVGQRFVALLAHHPWIEVVRVAASDRSAGKKYGEACRWLLSTPMPEAVAGMAVGEVSAPGGVDLAFSALSADIAGEIELAWAGSGTPVFSNSRNFRMEPDVPLMIPEINPEHLRLLETQPAVRNFPPSGFIVTNANCSATFLAMALAPLHRTFGVERVMVVTLQALSGAGYPGLSALDTTGNVIPFIEGEEAKLETETQKILGRFLNGGIELAPVTVSAQVNRVPVIDGHTESLTVKLGTAPPIEEVREALRTFSGEPQARRLPSAPAQPIVVLEGRDRPQPRLDLDLQKGMATIVGGLRPCSVLDFKMTILGHNTVRGAAGGSILNAELAISKGLIGENP
jgi:aspartate-semialdehyde dehydrogenase